MAESFNLNNFLRQYQSYNNNQYTAAENGKAAMEARDIQRAEEAVKENGFLTLTLAKKLEDAGIGERALQQFADTAMGIITDTITPLGDYLAKYENVFDERVYNSEIQAYAKQTFFAHQAMSNEAAQNVTGQNFVYDM